MPPLLRRQSSRTGISPGRRGHAFKFEMERLLRPMGRRCGQHLRQQRKKAVVETARGAGDEEGRQFPLRLERCSLPPCQHRRRLLLSCPALPTAAQAPARTHTRRSRIRIAFCRGSVARAAAPLQWEVFPELLCCPGYGTQCGRDRSTVQRTEEVRRIEESPPRDVVSLKSQKALGLGINVLSLAPPIKRYHQNLEKNMVKKFLADK